MDEDIETKTQEKKQKILANATVCLEKFFQRKTSYNTFTKEVIGHYKAYQKPLENFAKKYAH